MGKALYRKYRSRSLSEIVGQDHITTALSNALKQGKIAHAYLLTGPRGVGKTSIARILAYEINQLPYSEEVHFDIIEIDAASNNSVEDVRDLRDKIMSAPTSVAYKVFIIDEVHMLSKSAFNALLKTLEEPPAHVVFILATTESHRLPQTVISRTQRFSFRPVPAEQVVTHLRDIATKEGITVADDALQLIAEHGEGSFRDSIGLLDQVSSLGAKITKADIENLLGRVPEESIQNIADYLATHQATKAINELHSLVEQGYEPAMVAAQLGSLTRSNILEGKANSEQSIELLKQLLDIPAAHNPRALLEVLFLRYMPTTSGTEVVVDMPNAKQAPSAPKVTPEPQPAQAAPAPMAAKPEATTLKTPIKNEAKSEDVKEPNEAKTIHETEQPEQTNSDIDNVWHEVLQRIKKSHNTLYGIARMAQPTLEQDTLHLAFRFAFHQKRVAEARNHTTLTKIVEELRGRPTKIICTTVETPGEPAPITDAVSNISNIFGGAELLES